MPSVPGARAVHAGGGTSEDGSRRDSTSTRLRSGTCASTSALAGWQLARVASWAGAMVALGRAARRAWVARRGAAHALPARPRERRNTADGSDRDMTHIVQIAPFIGRGSGVAGVAWNLQT